MKKTAVLFLCALMITTYFAGCKLNQHATTLQGTIFNAITGERIGGKDMKIYLQQGTLLRTPDVFFTGEKIIGLKKVGDNSTIDLMGDYVFTNIPSMDNLSVDPTDPCPNEYRMTIIKDGYQRFEGIIDNDMLANKDNVIRNIYLFPEDYLIPCYTYTAKFSGKVVPGVTVMAAPYATLNPGILATDKWLTIDLSGVAEDAGATGVLIGSLFNVFTLFNNNYFFPAPGYLASIPEVTDDNGQVSFCENIVAGGAYAVCTAPVNFQDLDLVPQCKLLIAGYSATDQVFNLTTAQDTGNDYGLYAISVSNSADLAEPTGALTIIFNKPVTLTGKFGGSENSAAGSLDPVTPVNTSLSADGLTLTLTPNWAVQPGADELNISIDYTNSSASLSVAGFTGSKILLIDCPGSNYVRDSSGACIDGTVQIRN